MVYDIQDNQLQYVSDYILANTGLLFPPNKWNSLKKAIRAASTDLGMAPPSFIEKLPETPSSKSMINLLAGYLTIGETYFLRDKNFFQILKDRIIQDIIEQGKKHGKKINFLSAGCATGEEPYSIAILIDHMFPQLKQWKINIIGTDINTKFLEKARQGVYSRWSLRETPQQIVKKYFTQTDLNSFELDPRIKQIVRFVPLNLMENDYLRSIRFHEAMNVVLCRNVLMYFDESSRNAVIEKLSKLIAKNGWFITGPAEAGFVRDGSFSTVKHANIILYQKKDPLKKQEADFRSPPSAEKAFKAKSGHKSHNADHSSEISAKKTPQNSFREKPENEIYQEAFEDYQKGRYSASIKKLSGLLENRRELDADFLMAPELLILMAKSHANMGELKDADYWCKKAIESEKLNPEIYYLQSSIYQDAGNIKEAIRSIKQALYLDPDFITAHFILGMLFLQEKNLYECKKNLNNALSLLRNKDPEETVPFSEGMTAARLIETINGMLSNISAKMGI